MYDEVTLIKTGTHRDGIGQIVPDSETKTTVFCYADGVSRSEWNTAQQHDLEPTWKLEVESADYGGEKIAEFHGERFTIYRTFAKNGTTELYLGVRVGDISG